MKTIKHIVIPGGSIYGFSYYGVLRYLSQEKILNIDDLKTIHATSVGSIIGTLLALKYDWSELDNYLINRPWHLLFKFSLHSVIGSFQNNGIFGIDIIKELFMPLFNAKDIPIDISMKDFYDLSKIELHFFAVNFCTFELIDISHKTFPEWTLIEAIYASSCAPILFKPFLKNGSIYIDGGILSNCPLRQLIDDKSIDPIFDEIVSLNCVRESKTTCDEFSNMTLFKFIIILISKIIQSIQKRNLESEINKMNHILIDQNFIPVYDVHSIVNNHEHRILLIEHGVNSAKKSVMCSK
jgi:predicted acylesterase/phospholipase RssA